MLHFVSNSPPPIQENPADIKHTLSSLVQVQKSPSPSPSHHQQQNHTLASDSRAKKPSHHASKTRKPHRASKAPPSSKKPTKVPKTKEFDSVTPVPVPGNVWNCDISNLKDAMSALNRAKSPSCKELIHNVTCLQRAGKLYNTELKNTCPLKRNPGQGIEKVSYELGKGPPMRVVFLMSVHGRAVRQVKRLFKAIYHTDHYYFIHVDSVSAAGYG